MNGEVLIVDEHTGRILAGRRYNEGMHQAIEAKEGVEIKQENQTLATITLQNYFRLYDKLSGMTGTAMTEAAEFDQIYKLGVVPIPTNRDLVRLDEPDLVYRTVGAKLNSVIDDIAMRHEKGQPVLVGTTSVEKSEELSNLLRKRGVPHEVLNAKFHEREAAIVAQAGRKGAVTVATNMAGRGTDIMLGGNSEFMAAAELAQQELSPVDTPEEYEAAWPARPRAARKAVASEHEEVVSLGGLYVLGTERHESRRIDNQLRGRSGRQGDPGETRFYLSLEDDLMRLFKADIVDAFLRRFNVPDDVPIEAKMVSNAIRSAQTQVEAQNFEIRKNVLKYDEVMNRQRVVIYEERRRVLEGADLHEQIRGFLDDTIEGYVGAECSDGYAEDWDLDRLWTALRTLYPVGRHGRRARRPLGRRRATASPRSSSSRSFGPTRTRRTTSARPRWARTSCASSSVASCSRCSTASGASTSTRWTTCRTASACARWRRRTRSWSTSARATPSSSAMMESIKEESVGYLFNVEVQVPGEAEGTIESERRRAHPAGVRCRWRRRSRPRASHRSGRSGSSTPRPTSTAGRGAQRRGPRRRARAGPDASRAERRRAERAARKRDAQELTLGPDAPGAGAHQLRGRRGACSASGRPSPRAARRPPARAGLPRRPRTPRRRRRPAR